MEWMDLTSFIQIATIIFGVFGLIVSFIIRDIEKWPSRLCIAILSMTIISSLFALLESYVIYRQVPIPQWQAVRFGVLLFAPVPPLLFTAYFLNYCGENWKKSPLMYIQTTLTGALVIAEIVLLYLAEDAFKTDYTVDAGPRAILFMILILAITAVLLIALIRRRKKLSLPEFLAFLVCFMMPSYVQTLLLEVMLMIGLGKSYQAQKEEAERQRMRAAVLQMRPHFIHNTMMTIYSLCAQDPQKARQVTRDFSTYLQDNFTAIAQEDTIPFTKELEHTKAYLAVEMARFEGQLFVEFDTPVTYFRIPPLTLQPIVENSVKHGIDPELEPLYVTVATEDAGNGVRIIIEDTGPGYAPQEKHESQIALDNIRDRLNVLCGGTLDIAPREAGGTKVTIFVPWSEVQQV